MKLLSTIVISRLSSPIAIDRQVQATGAEMEREKGGGGGEGIHEWVCVRSYAGGSVIDDSIRSKI